jgi:hypothetical protein
MTQALVWGAPLALAVLVGAFGRGRFAGPLGWSAGALGLLALLLVLLAEG